MVNKFKAKEQQTETVAAAFKRFLDNRESLGRRPDTIRSYKTTSTDFLNFCTDNDIKVSSIDKKVIEKYKSHLLNKYTNNNTRNAYLRIVKAFVNYLAEDDIAPFKIKLFANEPQKEISIYTDEEIKKLLAKPKKQNFIEMRGYIMVCTLFATGMRKSSLNCLEIKDIDFRRDIMYLQHVKRENEYRYQIIPLPKDLKTILSKYISLFDLPPNSPLIPNVQGFKMCATSLNELAEAYFESRTVEYRGIHEFRRTYATKCAEIHDIDTLSDLMLAGTSVLKKHYIRKNLEKTLDLGRNTNLITSITKPKVFLHR